MELLRTPAVKHGGSIMPIVLALPTRVSSHRSPHAVAVFLQLRPPPSGVARQSRHRSYSANPALWTWDGIWAAAKKSCASCINARGSGLRLGTDSPQVPEPPPDPEGRGRYAASQAPMSRKVLPLSGGRCIGPHGFGRSVVTTPWPRSFRWNQLYLAASAFSSSGVGIAPRIPIGSIPMRTGAHHGVSPHGLCRASYANQVCLEQ